MGNELENQMRFFRPGVFAKYRASRSRSAIVIAMRWSLW
jgi:hypothetical protein